MISFMHGCKASFLPFLLLMLAGCARARTEPASPIHVARSIGFDAHDTGTIGGRVVWDGPVPTVPEFHVHTNLFPGKEALQGLVRANPNVPLVNDMDDGVGQAVVFLRGIDPAKSRPWDHGPVNIAMRDFRLAITQGPEPVRVGFVRRGDQITMVSHDKALHALHAGGAAFFTFMFADPEVPRARKLERAGLVELSSMTGYYWMRGYLFVNDHPYYARTDGQGHFRLAGVPAGRYQLVCWMPSWQVASQDRDPESSLISRIQFEPPIERVKEVVVERGGKCEVDFHIGASR
jgi:hypothetical protein